MRTVRVQAEDFDAAAEARALTAGRADVGALVSFVGLCRDEGGRLAALEIEHYPGMAEAEIARVVDEACERWPLIGVTAIHRFGTIAPGEPIVLVVAACRASRRGVRRGRDADGLSEDARAVLETRTPHRWLCRRLDRAEKRRRSIGGAMGSGSR